MNGYSLSPDPGTLRLVLNFTERLGLPALLLVLLGIVYLGFIPSPVLAKLEVLEASDREVVRIARLQCSFLAQLADRDGTLCFNLEPGAPVPKGAPTRGMPLATR